MAGKRKHLDERRQELVAAARAVALSDGLEQLTGRKVAAKAGLSSGLVFFHFESREALLEAVLDALIDDLFGDLTAPTGEGPPEERLLAFLEQRFTKVRGERRRVELFIDFCVLGLRNASIRKRIRSGLERYRDAVRPVGDELSQTRPGMSGDGLAQLTVSFILGSVLQFSMETGKPAPEALLASMRALLRSPRKKA